MPPEQASGRWLDVDARSDLWALGATMFKLLSGRTVRQATTADEELHAAIDGIAPSLADVCAAPAEVAAVVDRALAFDPNDRFPNAMAMQDAVREAMVSLEYTLPRESSPPMFGIEGAWLDGDEVSTAFSMRQDEQRSSSVRLKSLSLGDELGLRARLANPKSLLIGAAAVVVLGGLLAAVTSDDEVTPAKSSLSSLRALSPPARQEALPTLSQLDFGIDLSDVLKTDDDERRSPRRARPAANAPSEPFDPLQQRE
jgi:serine/threonine protein kinase